MREIPAFSFLLEFGTVGRIDNLIWQTFGDEWSLFVSKNPIKSEGDAYVDASEAANRSSISISQSAYREI